jgi:hypothetical protein
VAADDVFDEQAMSPIGPSLQILRWNPMSAFGVLRTSCEADTKRIGGE